MEKNAGIRPPPETVRANRGADGGRAASPVRRARAGGDSRSRPGRAGAQPEGRFGGRGMATKHYDQDGRPVGESREDDGSVGGVVFLVVVCGGWLLMTLFRSWVLDFRSHPLPHNLFAGYFYYGLVVPLDGLWLAVKSCWYNAATGYPNLNRLIAFPLLFGLLAAVCGLIGAAYSVPKWLFERGDQSAEDRSPAQGSLAWAFTGALAVYLAGLALAGGLELAWLFGEWLFRT